MSRDQNEVKVGATFHSQARGAFHQTSKAVWKVVAIMDTTNGLPHARLVNAADPLSSRMVAVSALPDKKLYRRAE